MRNEKAKVSDLKSSLKIEFDSYVGRVDQFYFCCTPEDSDKVSRRQIFPFRK